MLVDIEKLVEGHSHSDLDVFGDAELGKVIIGYYRDVRGRMEAVRDLAKMFDRARTQRVLELATLAEAVEQEIRSLTSPQAELPRFLLPPAR